MLIEIVLRIPFSVIGLCFLVPTSQWLQGKYARINLPPAAVSIILQNHTASFKHFSVKIAALGSLKWVTGRIFKISKYFQSSKLKL
jgi:hypothetical protein